MVVLIRSARDRKQWFLEHISLFLPHKPSRGHTHTYLCGIFVDGLLNIKVDFF